MNGCKTRVQVVQIKGHLFCVTLITVKSVSHRERGGSVVECRTPEREVRGSRPTAAVLCP